MRGRGENTGEMPEGMRQSQNRGAVALQPRDMYRDLRNSELDECQRYVKDIVSKLIKRMKLPQVQRDEFVSAGMLGLIEAADRYIPDRGVDFRAYAYLRVRGAVIDYVRSSCRLSASAYRFIKAIQATQALREEEQDHARRLGDHSKTARLERVVDFLTKGAAAYKLAAVARGAQGALECVEEESPEALLDQKLDTEKIRACIATLPEKERLIVEQYYFNDVSFTDVAKNHSGLSKSWVSRLHDKAITMLRDKYIEQSTNDDLEALGVVRPDPSPRRGASGRRV